MKITVLLVFIAWMISSCDNSEIAPAECEAGGTPEWVEAPQLVVGSSTVQVQFQINRPSNLFWAVYSAEQSSLSPEELKEVSTSGSAPNLLKSGSQDVECSEIDDQVNFLIEDLNTNGTGYLYVVAENSVDNSLQGNVQAISFELLERQVEARFSSSAESREVLYLLYQPDEFIFSEDDESFPLIVFLGGNGEVAIQGEINLIRNGSLPEYIEKGNDVPFIVASPQHIKFSWNIDMLDEFIDEMIDKYPVDVDRIFMTGISGGGIATWNYAVKHADRLKAIVPISGDGNDGQACNLTGLAVWAFHNDPDGIVSTNGSISMISSINACSPGPSTTPQLTLFEDPGHNAWRRVYDKEHPEWSKTSVAPVDIYEWLSSLE